MTVLSFALVSTSAAADVSGIYITGNEEWAEIIHIVEQKNGDIAGQFESVEISKSNKVEIESHSLSGVVRNGSIALKLDAPLSSLFGEKTFTGKISRGALTLSYSGNTGVYEKATEGRRKTVLKKIEATAESREQMEVAERARQNFVILKRNVESLSSRTESDINWFAEQKEVYSALFAKGRAFEVRWRSKRAQGVDAKVLIQIENAHSEVEKKVWAIDEDVKDRGMAIRKIRIEIERALKNLEEVCPLNGNTQYAELCGHVEGLEVKFEDTITGSRKAFDRLVAFRQTVKL